MDVAELIQMLEARQCRPRRMGANWLAKCPVHDDRKPSLSIGTGEDSRVLLRCFAGCSAQQIAESLGLQMADLFADHRMEWRKGSPNSAQPCALGANSGARRPDTPDWPQIDQERAQRLQELGHATIYRIDIDAWLLRRGITREWIAQNPILGFVERATIRGWTHPLINSWLIRIVADDGRCVALKAHREDPPPEVPKCCWLPFGTQPADCPRHGVSTFWPPVSWAPKAELLYLTEGELKAAALLCAGLSATSPTAGAGLRWNPWAVECFRGRNVVVVYDDDPAGVAFRDNSLAALRGHCPQLRAITYGKKP